MTGPTRSTAALPPEFAFKKSMTPIRIALSLFALGFVLFLGGWVYDIIFAGIPYQDAMSEQQANWDFHKTVASYIRFGAIGAWGAAILGFAIMSFSQPD